MIEKESEAGEKKREADKLAKLVESGLFTVNEAREQLELKPIPEPTADEILIKSSLTPISIAGEFADAAIGEADQTRAE